MKNLSVKKRNGRLEDLDLDKINKCVQRACDGLDDVSVSEVVLDAHVQLFDKITTKEIDKAMILSARSKIEKEPNYNYVAARLLLNTIYKEVFGEGVDSDVFEMQYKKSFIQNIKKLVKEDRLSPKLLSFDFKKLSDVIDPSRDKLFKYLGIQILYDRYLLQSNDIRVETPQAFWMRVAMGLAVNEGDAKEEKAIEFYNVLSNLRSVSSTPTLFNSGTKYAQMSSCYLSTQEDSINGIFRNFQLQARLSKHAGGLGVDFTPCRATNAHIKGTNGKSSGVIPWIKIMGDTANAVNQSGKRLGAAAVYLQTWHGEIEDFLDMRKPVGDERRRTVDLNLANWIPDLFMKQVKADGDWHLFSPDETEDLIDLYGADFEKRYGEYIQKGTNGELKFFRQIKAKELWKKMLSSQMQFGGPWMTWKDPINIRNPQRHIGSIRSSNLCCMTKDQRVVTDLGLLTVEELYNTKRRSLVASRKGTALTGPMLMPRPNAPIVKVVTNQGYSHKVTPDHKIWVIEKGWVEVKDLIAGDKIELQQDYHLHGKLSYENEAFIAGMIIGDGCCSQHSATTSLWKKDFSIRKEVEKKVSMIIKNNPDISINTSSTKNPKFITRTNGEISLTSAPLLRILTKLGFDKSNKLSIPDFVWKGNKKTIAAFLRGLYIADGTIQANKEISTFSLASASKGFIEEIQILLMSFGIKTSINKMRDNETHLMPDGKGGKKEYNCNPLYRLLITSIRASKKFEELTKFGSFKKNKQIIKNLLKSGYREKIYCEFSHLENLPNEDAYCLNVKNEDHSWTVNGMITKNTETTLVSKPSKYDAYGETVEFGEIAVCNLQAINLAAYIKDGEIMWKLLEKDIKTSIRMLDNVIDENYYPVKEAEISNKKHRPIMLGIMGWHDLLLALNINYDSKEAVELAGKIQEFISYHSIMASCELAKEKGKYPSYEGSTWSQGIFPQDTYKELCKYRDIKSKVKETLDWDLARACVKEHGMRNSNSTANQPTATISYISGCSQSFEAYYRLLYTYSTLSGEATVICDEFYKEMKKTGLLSLELVEALKKAKGDITLLNVPDEIKEKYKNPYYISYENIIDANAERQIWIDQSQSLNLFSNTQSMKYHNDMYFYAWEKLCKTTYYLRSKAASGVKVSEANLTEKKLPLSEEIVEQFEEVRKEYTEEQVIACRIDAETNGVVCEACQ